jgi:dihydropteroate synthase
VRGEERLDSYDLHNLRVVEVANRGEARLAIREVGADPGGVSWMTPKAVHRLLRVENLSTRSAIILKQEMLSRGGEAAISRGAGDFSVDMTDVLLMGTLKQYDQLCHKLKAQPFGLARLARSIRAVLDNVERQEIRQLRCRDLTLAIGERTLIMGILNVTPDSFSDGGRWSSLDGAVAHAREMVEEGADIIDVGGESTRPQTWTGEPLPAEEETSRILPVLERLLRAIDVPISVDTYKAATARTALKEGAHIINDIWGFKKDPDLARVAANYDAPVILMHNQDGTEYHSSLMGEVIGSLRQSIKVAEDAGVRPEQIVVDPGIGFGKNTEQNLEALRHLGELRSLGKPILLGTSRKSVIGNTLNLPVDQRLEGTAATVAWGIARGADIIRVHDVREMSRVARMVDAIIRG